MNALKQQALILKNIKLVTKETSPVIHIINSDKILFDNIGYNDYSELLMELSGSRTKDIKLINTDMLNLKQLADLPMQAQLRAHWRRNDISISITLWLSGSKK